MNKIGRINILRPGISPGGYDIEADLTPRYKWLVWHRKRGRGDVGGNNSKAALNRCVLKLEAGLLLPWAPTCTVVPPRIALLYIPFYIMWCCPARDSGGNTFITCRKKVQGEILESKHVHLYMYKQAHFHVQYVTGTICYTRTCRCLILLLYFFAYGSQRNMRKPEVILKLYIVEMSLDIQQSKY